MLGEMKFTSPEKDFIWPHAFNNPNADRKIFSDSKVKEKYKKFFNNHETVFNFYINNTLKVDDDNIKDFYQDICDSNTKKNKNQITIIFNYNNGTTNFVPFTPWILAHRSFHAYDISKEESILLLNPLNSFLNSLRKPFRNSKDNVLYCDYKVGNFQTILVRASQKQIYVELIRPFLKFKSARDNNLTGLFEVPTELWAQFIIQGKVSLKRYHEANHPLKWENPAEIDKAIEKFENEYNNMFKNILKENAGKYWVF